MIRVENLSFSYPKREKAVLEDVSFEVGSNRCVAVLGTNGAGKSTLLKTINRILTPQKGAVYLDGVDVQAMSKADVAKNIGFVPQRNRALNMTVFDVILLGRRPYITWEATREDRIIAAEMMERLSLEDYALRNVAELSGGEAQQVSIARALTQEPKVLLLDEPTSNLDPHNQHEVLRLLSALAREKEKTVMVVLHDLNLAIRYCDSFILLKDNRLFAHGDVSVMTPENIKQVYNIEAHVIRHGSVPLVVPYPR